MELVSAFESVAEKLFLPLVVLVDPRNPFSYVGALFFLFFAIVSVRARRPRNAVSLRAIWRLISRRGVWFHRSAILDYKIYLVSLLLSAFVFGFLVLGMDFWAHIFGNALTALVGPAAVTTSTHWGIVILIALVLLAAHDGGYWLHHWALHKSEVLWQIHKLHHSAEVMTPATEWRQHPIEQMWAATVISVTTGFFYAFITHWFGTGAISMGVIQYSIITCIHTYTFHHLRHTHINMRFTGVLGVIFHSPAHHQIHHSDNPAHFDRNLGYFLSIWDWMAGTLYMPRAGETISSGLGADESEYHGIVDAMWVPLRDAATLIRRKFAVRTSTYKAEPIERATPTTLSAAP